jgi:putative ABC transport system ATP-binding protein
MTGVTLHNVCKRFDAPGNAGAPALDGVSATFTAGEMTIVVGANGSGKSTLLNVIAGDMPPDSGSITFVADKTFDALSLSPRARSRIIGRIFQDPSAGSVDDFDVEENLCLAKLQSSPKLLQVAMTGRRRRQIVETLGGTALRQKAKAKARELSHGQRQLLALEMAAARRTSVLLLDEPTASLDRDNAASCAARAEAYARTDGATVIFVTHDMGLAAAFGQRLLVLKDGRLAHDLAGNAKASLTPEAVFRLCGFSATPPHPPPS